MSENFMNRVVGAVTDALLGERPCEECGDDDAMVERFVVPFAKGDGGVLVFPIGKFFRDGKERQFTPEQAQQMVDNFKNNLLGRKDGWLPVNGEHERWRGRVGYITDMVLVDGQPHAVLKETKEGAFDSFDYLSPEIRWEWQHPYTGETHKNVLMGAALTNYPFLLGRTALHSDGGMVEFDAPYIWNEGFSEWFGGPGSGHFGHKGTPGRGGSAPGGGGVPAGAALGKAGSPEKLGYKELKWADSLQKTEGDTKVTIRRPNPKQLRENYEVTLMKGGTKYAPKAKGMGLGTVKTEAEAIRMSEAFFKGDKRFVTHDAHLNGMRTGAGDYDSWPQRIKFSDIEDGEMDNYAESERERLHKAQDGRASRYGIAGKKDGNLTPPKGYPTAESEYGDPVNYRYPADAAHARPALTYFNQEGQREDGGYTSAEWAKIGQRLAKLISRHLRASYTYKGGKLTQRKQGGEEMAESFAHEVPFMAADEAQRIVYGVVFAPGVPDGQGHIVNAEEIEGACHRFTERLQGASLDGHHARLVQGNEARIVESWIQTEPATWRYADRETEIAPGSWCVAVKIYDDELWGEIVDGRIAGFSPVGTATGCEV